jgi:hypothetical protein
MKYLSFFFGFVKLAFGAVLVGIEAALSILIAYPWI